MCFLLHQPPKHPHLHLKPKSSLHSETDLLNRPLLFPYAGHPRAHTHYSSGHITRRLLLKPQGTLWSTNLMPDLHQILKKQLPGRQGGSRP